MSQRDVSRFVTLGLDDAQLRETLRSDPAAAFQGYDLTDQEKQLIQSGDAAALTDMGVDAMTARSWASFHDVGAIAPDMPDVSGDLPPKDP